jgi:hypothetical protein
LIEILAGFRHFRVEVPIALADPEQRARFAAAILRVPIQPKRVREAADRLAKRVDLELRVERPAFGEQSIGGCARPLRFTGPAHVDDDLVRTRRARRVVGANPHQMPALVLDDDRYLACARVDERSPRRVGNRHDRSDVGFADDNGDELPRLESDLVEM